MYPNQLNQHQVVDMIINEEHIKSQGTIILIKSISNFYVIINISSGFQLHVSVKKDESLNLRSLQEPYN